jgi:predicted transcriptional regulator
MATPHKPMSLEEAVAAVPEETTAEVRAWQKQKILNGLKAADEGRFASREAVRSVIQKFIPNG